MALWANIEGKCVGLVTDVMRNEIPWGKSHLLTTGDSSMLCLSWRCSLRIARSVMVTKKRGAPMVESDWPD